MNISNRIFIWFEMSFGGWVLSHTIINDTLQTLVLLLSLIGAIIGIFRAAKRKK